MNLFYSQMLTILLNTRWMTTDDMITYVFCVHRSSFSGQLGCRADWYSDISLSSAWRCSCKHGNWSRVRELQKFFPPTCKISPVLINTDSQGSETHIPAGVSSVLDPEPQNQTGSASGRAAAASASQLKALAEAAQLTCVHKPRTWVERHHATRNAIQRQNRVRQGVQHNVFHLQQPGLRNLCHWGSDRATKHGGWKTIWRLLQHTHTYTHF